MRTLPKSPLLALGALFVALFTGFSQAGVITSVESAGVLSSQQAGATSIDFETMDCSAYNSCTGDFEVRTGSIGGITAAPYQATPDGEYFLTVPRNASSGSVSLQLNGSYNYFGLFWGSIDRYNTLSFMSGAATVASFGGSYFNPPLQADGGQGNWDSNRFINFLFTGGDSFDTVVLTSTSYAFETDNHAYANVPEPGVLSMLGLGLLCLGLTRFRRRTLKF